MEKVPKGISSEGRALQSLIEISDEPEEIECKFFRKKRYSKVEKKSFHRSVSKPVELEGTHKKL